MKILGEKSLSSKVVIGLKTLFTIINIADIIVLVLIFKDIRDIITGINKVYDLTILFVILITGIIALLIIYQFIKIFKNLKEKILFSEDNSKKLKTISINCFVISILYFIATILLFIMRSEYIFIYYVSAFSLMFTIIFAVSGIGVMILNEIYIEAIKYKEENDFTI